MPQPASSEALDRANAMTTEDLNRVIQGHETFVPPKHSNQLLTTKAYHVDDLPASLRDFALGLVESNMKDLYAKSKHGWSRDDKQEEMQGSHSRYLICSLASNPIAMVHFQFIQEETATDRNADVAYCYEIQVDRDYQSLGIGAYLLGVLEHICHATQLEKVMMTVFKANKRAIQFYIDKLGYKYDEISPCVYLTRGRASRFDYEILSKIVEP